MLTAHGPNTARRPFDLVGVKDSVVDAELIADTLRGAELDIDRILDRHNAPIWCEGKPDGGAIFWFALSLASSGEPLSRRQASEHKHAGNADSAGGRQPRRRTLHSQTSCMSRFEFLG
jgi:hypothetical protein